MRPPRRSWPQAHGLGWGIATLMLVPFAMAACVASQSGVGSERPVTSSKPARASKPEVTSTPTVRTDQAPIAGLFPVLGEPREVRWTGVRRGGEPRGITVPGPSTVRLRALIRLDAVVLRGAVTGYRWDVVAAPQIDAALSHGFDLSGPWFASEDYSSYVLAKGGADYSGQVLMNKKSGMLYLEADIS